MKKRILRTFIILALLLLPLTINANGPIKLWMDGQYLQTDADPVIENGRTLVPLRVISESLGYEVSWDAETKTVLIYKLKDGLMDKSEKQLGLTIGDKKVAILNPNEAVERDRLFTELDVASKIIKDRTFVPIRFIAEEFGLKVDWDNDNRTVVIGDGYQKPVKKESANTFTEAKVLNVVDGDTIDVLINGQKHRVRLILVDTPETKHPKKGVEYFGREASEYTRSQLQGKTVYLEKDVSETDRYGRLLRYVWLARPMTNNPSNQEIASKCFNSLLLENGYAKVTTFPPDVKYVDFFRTREAIARDSNYGLWGQGGQDVTPQPSPQNNSNSNNTGGYRDPHDPAYKYANGRLIGNKNSGIYHVPGQQGYKKVAYKNAIFFDTAQEAINAGYRAAKR